MPGRRTAKDRGRVRMGLLCGAASACGTSAHWHILLHHVVVKWVLIKTGDDMLIWMASNPTALRSISISEEAISLTHMVKITTKEWNGRIGWVSEVAEPRSAGPLIVQL
jgi:hypothetical protein